MTLHRIPTTGTHPKVHTPSRPIPEPTIPQTPYVNQAAVEQHRRTQSPSVPPMNIATVVPPPRESPQASYCTGDSHHACNIANNTSSGTGLADHIPTMAKAIKKQGWPRYKTIKKCQHNRHTAPGMFEMR